jgi:hypothetical protein
MDYPTTRYTGSRRPGAAMRDRVPAHVHRQSGWRGMPTAARQARPPPAARRWRGWHAVGCPVAARLGELPTETEDVNELLEAAGNGDAGDARGRASRATIGVTARERGLQPARLVHGHVRPDARDDRADPLRAGPRRACATS